MYTSQGPGGIFYSAVEQEPEMHPLIELGLSLSPYVGGAYGAAYLGSKAHANSEYTYFDTTLKRVQNVLNKFPMGFLNTFRISEFGSYNLSGAALGLEEATSVEGERQIRRQIFGKEFFHHADTIEAFKETIGKDAYDKASPIMQRGNYEFVYEMEKDQRGRGNLYIRELQSDIVAEGKTGLRDVSKPRPGSTRLVSRDIGLMQLPSGVESLDLLIDEDVRSVTNPAPKGVVQNLTDRIDNFQNLYRSNVTGQQPKVIPVPSILGELNTVGDLKRRTAVIAGYLSMGVDRFNKLLRATFNQIPLLGRTLERAMDTTGFSLKTKPSAFYKQFMSLGLKATKIGALSLGISTLDHYREQFGVAGNLVASTGVSFGLMAAYDKFAKEATTTAKTRLGLISFGAQMILPGFDKGVVEGLATTAVKLDIGRSYIGKYSGLSYIRRGIEGALPGSTNFTSGLYLGLAAAGLSYSGYGKRFVERGEKGSLHFGDTMFKSIDDLIKGRFGFVGHPDTGKVRLPLTPKELMGDQLLDILYPAKESVSKTYSENFMKLNPFAERLKELGGDNDLITEYRNRLEAIMGETPADKKMTGGQIKDLKKFFKGNELLMRKIMGENIDEGKFIWDLENFDLRISDLERSEVYKATKVTNEVNESLLRRVVEINERYASNDIISNIARRAEIFGAEIYHSFFGATMTGDVNITIDGKETVKEITEKGLKKLVPETYEEVAKRLKASPMVRRFGALTMGVTLLHQMMTGAFFGMMEDPEELKGMYSGEKLVEVKKGRWWEAGGTPYEGGQTSYFRPHAYHSLMTNAREKSVWGEEADTYSPLTRFFLKNFTYHLEEKNYYSRPYPMTGAAFEDIPVIGKLLSATIGRVIKPTKLMHEDELYRDGPNGREIAYPREYGSSPELGELPPGIPSSAYDGMQALGAIQYTFREIEGLTGYAKNVMQKMITGREVLGTRQYIMQNSNMMDSATGSYWSKDLGGFAFMSEPMRRLFPRPRAEIESYNPIMNSMPSYVPERFKRGDPYLLLPNGYARLPGQGYEALNPDVKGLDPEDYPDIHKYKILADVAPQSRGTIKLRNELMERRAGGILTEHEVSMLENANEYHQKRLAATRSDLFHENAIKIPYISDGIAAGYLGLTELIRRGSAAAENLIPGGFRPSAKLLGHTRDAIETYEYERVYNTSNSFWDAPVRDWFRPAMLSAAHFIGWDGKPIHVKKREELDAHFDKLQFIKWMKLAEGATNGRDKKRYLNLAARTRTGVNPEGDSLSMYLSLPTADKRFFDAFAKAEGSDRERILEVVPEDQKHLYESVWKRLDEGEELSLLSSDKPIINEGYMYQRLAEVQEDMKLGPMPKADWIGWHKDVDMNDIKVKYIGSLGEDIHDYDAWQSQVRRMSRKPYLEGSEKFMYNGFGPTRRSMRNSIIRNSGPSVLNSAGYLFNSSQAHGDVSRANLTYNDDRLSEISALANSSLRG
jgi:hypothetical protein